MRRISWPEGRIITLPVAEETGITEGLFTNRAANMNIVPGSVRWDSFLSLHDVRPVKAGLSVRCGPRVARPARTKAARTDGDGHELNPGRGPSSMATSLIGKHPAGARQPGYHS